MHFDDLQRVIHIAHTQNIQISARALNITAGALSKTLKKIEHKLNTDLFDRIGRNIQLNDAGKKFITYAVNLTHEYEQMCSEFTDKMNKHLIKLAGPSVLLDTCLERIIPLIADSNIELTIEALYEGDAVKNLISGQAQLAIVTDEALSDVHAFFLESIPLGITTSRLVAGYQHPIFDAFPDGKVPMDDLLNYPFICPKSSPFCGIERGVGSDGWSDHQYPRQIAFRSDDLKSLLSIVNQGVALAYLADIVVDTEKLRCIEVSDYDTQYQEKYSLLYKPSIADGWLNQLVYRLRT